ncbi:hypothetical protein [Fusobacterium sp.]|uniref:hypothetical protein n=1 Tax=Fusobacterium sp. TaxID=68766 RepID=UPI0025C34794|nr:hypothetical protein [Fusobacterium sp.]
MVKIKEFNIRDHKEKIVVFIGFSIVILAINFLFYKPYVQWSEKNQQVEKFILDIRKEKTIGEAGEKRYKRLEEELEKEQERVELFKNRVVESSFLNIVKFEEYISEMSQKNLLLLDTIGRVERVQETDKIYIPYVVSGDVGKILEFMEEIEETNEKKVSLSETGLTLEIKEEKARLICKFSANVLEKKMVTEVENEELIPLSRVVRERVKEIKILNYNNKKYIILKKVSGQSEIFFEGKIVIFQGKKYEIITKNSEVFIKLTE